MKTALRWFLACSVAIIVLPDASAAAHPDYEHYECSVVDKAGRKGHLIKVYTDGVLDVDPVRIVLRNENGFPLDETESGRDANVACKGGTDGYVFRHRGSLSVFPLEVLHVEGSSFVRVEDFWLRVLGLLVSIREHWLGYLIATLFLLGPLVAVRRMLAGARRADLATMTVLVGLAFAALLAWLYGVIELSRLSLPIALLTACLALAGDRLIRVGRTGAERRLSQ